MMENELIRGLSGLPGQDEGRLLSDEPMSRWTTFRAGGPADVVFLPASVEEIRSALQAARAACVPVTVLGRGSNVLVSDAGIRGLVVLLSAPFSAVDITPEADGRYRVRSEAGALLRSVALRCADASLTGMEFAAGIPGSLGGAVYMNAGAYDGQMADVVEESDVMAPDGTVRTLRRAAHEFGYRSSALMRGEEILLCTRLVLRRGDPARIRARIEELAARRRNSQPLELPSAGSTFKRPPDAFAGRLISDCGLRGLRIGDAQVSEKHAGFIVNLGQAASGDIRALVWTVVRTVREATGITLEPEVRFIGDWRDWAPPKL